MPINTPTPFKSVKRNIVTRISFYTFSLALLCASAKPAQGQSVHVSSLDSLFQEAAARNILQGSVLVSYQDKVVYKKAFGKASAEYGIRNDVNTKYKLASLSKTFTAVIIMQLVQEGKLSVTDVISDHLDWYPKNIGYFVNIQNLMRMTSGIQNYTSFYNFTEDIMPVDFKVKDYIMNYCTTGLLFQPGSDSFDYSNSNYYILGAIIESVTGKSFADVVQERIFDPLGMDHSGYYLNTGIYKNMATGYSVEPVREVAAYYDQSSAYSTGGLYSTVEDMYKFDQGLYSNKFLLKKYRDEIFTNPYPANPNSWGYAWEFITDSIVYKSGNITGFRTVFLRNLSNHTSIVILNNTDNSNSTGQNILVGILKILAGGYFASAPPPQQDISILMVDIIRKKNVDAAISAYLKISGHPVEAARWMINDTELLTVGQYLLTNHNNVGAQKIYALLAREFPNSNYATFKK